MWEWSSFVAGIAVGALVVEVLAIVAVLLIDRRKGE